MNSNCLYRRLLLFLLFFALNPLPTQAALTLIPGEGFVDDAGDSLHTDNAKGQLDLARSLESKEAWKDALKSYSYLVRKWPLSIYSGEAQFKVGLMNEKMGEFWRAFKAYQLVVSKYPGSQFFDLAIERQYSIGSLFLAGERQKLWKIPLLSSQEKTTEIFQSVIKAAPYGKYAAPSYFQIGQARERQQKWTHAIQSYNTILDKYPNSDLADDAQYQIGFAWLQASRQTEYDQSSAQKAIQAFDDFLTRFPKSEKAAQAELHVRRLKGRTSQGTFNIARFYERQRNYKAAYIYYNEVIKESANSPYAHKAQARIEIYKKLFEKQNKKLPFEPTAPGDGSANAKLDLPSNEPLTNEQTTQAANLAQDTQDLEPPTTDVSEEAIRKSDSTIPTATALANTLGTSPEKLAQQAAEGNVDPNDALEKENVALDSKVEDPIAQVEKTTRLELGGQEQPASTQQTASAHPDDVLNQLDQVIKADQKQSPSTSPSNSSDPSNPAPSPSTPSTPSTPLPSVTPTGSSAKPPAKPPEKNQQPAKKEPLKEKETSSTPAKKTPAKKETPPKPEKASEKPTPKEKKPSTPQPVQNTSTPQKAEPVKRAIPNKPAAQKAEQVQRAIPRATPHHPNETTTEKKHDSKPPSSTKKKPTPSSPLAQKEKKPTSSSLTDDSTTPSTSAADANLVPSPSYSSAPLTAVEIPSLTPSNETTSSIALRPLDYEESPSTSAAKETNSSTATTP